MLLHKLSKGLRIYRAIALKVDYDLTKGLEASRMFLTGIDNLHYIGLIVSTPGNSISDAWKLLVQQTEYCFA